MGESAFWLPALLAIGPRVRWEPLEESAARLVVPSGEGEESFVARFDAGTGLLNGLEGLKSLSGPVGGNTFPAVCVITWADDGTPWAGFRTEDVAYNVEVGTSSGREVCSPRRRSRFNMPASRSEVARAPLGLCPHQTHRLVLDQSDARREQRPVAAELFPA